MTLLAMVRFLFLTILELVVLMFLVNDLMEDVEKNGFHWFRTPFMSCLILLGYLMVIFKILEALNEDN